MEPEGTAAAAPAAPKIFISFSHQDREMLENLLVFLRPYERSGLRIWYDKNIRTGDVWTEAIETEMDEANIVLLLVSPDFLASNFCAAEVAHALKKKKTVIPIFLKDGIYEKEQFFDLQGAPGPKEPVASFSDKYKAWTLVTRHVLAVLKDSYRWEPPNRSRPSRLLTTQAPPDLDQFRQRFKMLYSYWEGGSRVGLESRPQFEDMYVPAKFAKGGTQTMAELDLAALGRKRIAWLIEGGAGSGKTVFGRWLFNRLLEDKTLLPLMVEMRFLAQSRSSRTSRLESYLGQTLVDYCGEAWTGTLPTLLNSSGGPLPVLILEGWDEIGTLGAQLHSEVLNLLVKYPHLSVIATSRPGSGSAPDVADGFEVFEIQPFSRDDIEDLAYRYYQTYGFGLDARQQYLTQFVTRLQDSPETFELSRTPLLLNVLLRLNEYEPLPQQRHQVYEQWAHHIITTWPVDSERDRAQWWRPDAEADRLHALCQLAYKMQSNTYGQGHRGLISLSEAEIEKHLPMQWKPNQRKGFRAWMRTSTGVLVDRVDYTLSFPHLSLQEYLAAKYLQIQLDESGSVVHHFAEHVHHEDWWDTLSFLGRLAPANQVEQALQSLVDNPDAACLAGTLLANGLGSDAVFEKWSDRFVSLLVSCWPYGAERCAAAFASKQYTRRRRLLRAKFAARVAECGWLSALRLAEWCDAAGFPKLEIGQLASPTTKQILSAREMPAFNTKDPEDKKRFAVSRMLGGGSPFWPLRPSEFTPLRLWPSYRRMAGERMQLLASLGAGRRLLLKVGETVLQPKAPAPESEEVAQELALSLQRAWRSNLAGPLGQLLTVDWVRDWACEWARERVILGALDLAHEWAAEWSSYLTRYAERAAWRKKVGVVDWVAAVTDFPKDWTRYLALSARRAHTIEEEFRRIDATCWGRSGLRALFAHVVIPSEQVERAAGKQFNRADRKVTNLLSQTCAVSLHPNEAAAIAVERVLRDEWSMPALVLPDLVAERWSRLPDLIRDSSTVAMALSRDMVEPFGILAAPLFALELVPAFARHLMRRSTVRDKHLLTEIARDPRLSPAPIRWAIEHFVRGDVVLSDGTVILLDELSAELGIGPLPYLEESLPALEVDWDE